MEETLKAYEELGKQWLAGAEIYTFGCVTPGGCPTLEHHKSIQCPGFFLTEKQKQFVNNKSPELLISGGFRSGKTVGLIIKIYLLSMFFPNNQILLGRKSLTDIQLTLLPAIDTIWPRGTYEHKPGFRKFVFPNGSEVHYMGLDTAVSGDDTKKATQKIRGLDLGGAFLDQLEEIEQLVWDQLSGRMSRKVPFHQRGATTNPARFWAYSYFKEFTRPGRHLIETGMLDNKANLPEGFIEQNLAMGEMYVRKFVYGEWTNDTMVEGRVFDKDVVRDQSFFVKPPIREVAGIQIFVEPEDHEYQIGIDPSIGAEDPCSIVCVDKITGDVVATFSGFVPTNVITTKALILAEMYSKRKMPLIIPEATGVGQALVEDLKRQYEHIYEREVFSKRESKTIDKLGFYTNYATKIQLIENMNKLFQAKWPKIRDSAILKEVDNFIWSDEAKRQGAGAGMGHDDRIMATMLAFWNLKPVELKKRNILQNSQKTPSKVTYQYQ